MDNLFKNIKDDLFFLILQFRGNRISSDRYLLSFLMNFRTFRQIILQSKLGKVGKNIEIDSSVTLVGTKNIEIGNNVSLSHQTFLSARSGGAATHGKIIIGNNVSFAPNVFVVSGKHKFRSKHASPSDHPVVYNNVSIGDGAYIGAGAIILPGVKIGRGAVVGAGAIVTKDVGDYSIVTSPSAVKLKEYHIK